MLTDVDVITFGIHKGKMLRHVPSSYLMWLYDNGKMGRELREYIKDNIEVLRVEARREGEARFQKTRPANRR